MAPNDSLISRLPFRDEPLDDLLERFLDWVAAKNLTLYPSQEDAILEIYSGKNLILNTPTGSGKSLVATAAHFDALARGQTSFYTSPIKALVSEKFFALCKDFGPDNVGMITGDASVNAQAPIICCTAEILSNRCLREGAQTAIDCVIMDEFHYYSDKERGVAWQVPLLTLPHARFLLMSATLGDTTFFARDLTQRTKRETAVVKSKLRPVPLDFEYRETPLHETLLDLVNAGKTPVYIVNFTQKAAAEVAQDLLSTDFCSKDQKKQIAEALSTTRFESPYGKEISKLLRHGVGIHHAGLLPKYRLLVEKLAGMGLLKIICGTDTLGVGVNIPLRTVLFTRLCKYDGEKTAILTARDFHQIAGRAGRKGFDDQGSVVVQAPEHVIENLRLDAKASADPSKKKKIVKKKPPDFGFVPWDRATFEKLVASEPEALVSRFSVSHAMILSVLQRPFDGCKSMVRLLRDNHDTDAQKRVHRAQAKALYQSLLDAMIIERTEHGLRVNADLQWDFSLHQSLSLYLLEALELLDVDSPDYALDVLTVAESICEDPEPILRRQLDKLKDDAMAQMKASGVQYEDRMSKLSELEYPKPLREFIYGTFNEFRKRAPWAPENVKPKSIAREMFEFCMGFSEYIKAYGLARVEGLLLRYLSEVYKVVAQTVPHLAKTPEVEDIEVYLSAIIRQVDNSLLEEWERMRNPEKFAVVRDSHAPDAPDAEDITRDERAFAVLIRNVIFEVLRALVAGQFATVRELVGANDVDGVAWSDGRLAERLTTFVEENGALKLDVNARAPKHVRIARTGPTLWVSQRLFDERENDDWSIDFEVDLVASRDAGRPVIKLAALGRIG